MPTADSDRLGVCSWSLQPDSPDDLVRKILALGLHSVQLHLDPLREGAWSADSTVELFRAARIRIASGMMGTIGEDYSTVETIRVTGGVRPDEHWEANLRAAEGNANLARKFGIPLVTFHAGFLPHESTDPLRVRMIERLRRIAQVFASRRVRIAFETGQEDANTLLGVLSEMHESLPEPARPGVNFDPANMILYGMGDPVESLRKLAPHVLQLHIKDALPTSAPGTWGTEVRVGTGAVDWVRFFRVVRESGINCDFMIERESGDERESDIAAARDLVRQVAAQAKGSSA